MNAREFLTKGFVRKDVLRRFGPQRLLIAKVDSRLGKAWDGKPAMVEPVVEFADGQLLSLRTQANLNRLLEGLGEETDLWTGRIVEVYFDPEVRNPTGSVVGGVRVRILDPAEELRARAEQTVRVAVPVPEVPKDVIPF